MFETPQCLLHPTAFLVNHLLYAILFVIAVGVQHGICIIPEASQEGGLRSFKSYEDVVMFHYNVPKQVLRATWQFSAFMDNSECPQRKVNIFLKWGSYPVFTVNNASYPSYMHVDHHDSTYITATTDYEAKSMTIVPVYSPVPGDWFVGAYLSYIDEKVHQKGLGHKCRYSLGSIAIWSEISGIQNIPLGYQETVMTSETISYYKMFIPMDTWSFQVDIWGCNSSLKTEQAFRIPCIKNLALKGRALPVYNHSNPSSTGNLTFLDTYTFTELTPFQDSWYYLMVVTSHSVKFSIKVTVNDCPIRTLEEALIRQYIKAPLYYKVSSQHLLWKNLKEHSLMHNSTKQNETLFNSLSRDDKSNTLELDRYNLNSCVPRYQLVRIKHNEAFSGNYLLRGREWLTSWIALTDSYPIITQFDILPLIDVGGTLDVNISLEMNDILRKQQINVTVCVTHGQFSKVDKENLVCDNEKIVMKLSTNEMHNASLLIPYPQPDIWYIAFHTACFVNGMPAHCKVEEVLISLKIKLRACVFEGSNSCGDYGVCEKIHKGLLFYTACKCFGGRQGWGCTDTSDALSELTIVLTTVALTLSNLFFIPAIYLAGSRKFYAEGLVYSCAMLFSALYHACDQQSSTYCIAKYEVLQYCDFFFGMLAFWVTLVAMAELPIQFIPSLHMFGVIVITFEVESDKTGLLNALIPLVIGSLIPLSSYIYACYQFRKFERPKRLIKLTIGLSLAAFGILLYTLVETESNYKYVHSLWHIVIAVSLLFLLPPIKEDETQNNKTQKNELLSRESSDNSDLIVNNTPQFSDQLIVEIN